MEKVETMGKVEQLLLSIEKALGEAEKESPLPVTFVTYPAPKDGSVVTRDGIEWKISLSEVNQNSPQQRGREISANRCVVDNLKDGLAIKTSDGDHFCQTGERIFRILERKEHGGQHSSALLPVTIGDVYKDSLDRAEKALGSKETLSSISDFIAGVRCPEYDIDFVLMELEDLIGCSTPPINSLTPILFLEGVKVLVKKVMKSRAIKGLGPYAKGFSPYLQQNEKENKENDTTEQEVKQG